MGKVERFQWKPEYVIGNDLVDQEHRTLIVLANLLYSAVSRGQGEEVVRQAFSALDLYTRKHFADEEALLARLESPELDTHRGQHRELVKELAELHEKEMQGLVGGVSDALERWIEGRLVPHMAYVDQKAVRAGREKGKRSMNACV